MKRTASFPYSPSFLPAFVTAVFAGLICLTAAAADPPAEPVKITQEELLEKLGTTAQNYFCNSGPRQISSEWHAGDLHYLTTTTTDGISAVVERICVTGEAPDSEKWAKEKVSDVFGINPDYYFGLDLKEDSSEESWRTFEFIPFEKPFRFAEWIADVSRDVRNDPRGIFSALFRPFLIISQFTVFDIFNHPCMTVDSIEENSEKEITIAYHRSSDSDRFFLGRLANSGRVTLRPDLLVKESLVMMTIYNTDDQLENHTILFENEYAEVEGLAAPQLVKRRMRRYKDGKELLEDRVTQYSIVSLPSIPAERFALSYYGQPTPEAEISPPRGKPSESNTPVMLGR